MDAALEKGDLKFIFAWEQAERVVGAGAHAWFWLQPRENFLAADQASGRICFHPRHRGGGTVFRVGTPFARRHCAAWWRQRRGWRRLGIRKTGEKAPPAAKKSAAAASAGTRKRK